MPHPEEFCLLQEHLADQADRDGHQYQWPQTRAHVLQDLVRVRFLLQRRQQDGLDLLPEQVNFFTICTDEDVLVMDLHLNGEQLLVAQKAQVTERRLELLYAFDLDYHLVLREGDDAPFELDLIGVHNIWRPVLALEDISRLVEFVGE